MTKLEATGAAVFTEIFVSRVPGVEETGHVHGPGVWTAILCQE